MALDLRVLTLPGVVGVVLWLTLGAALWRALRDAPARRDLWFLATWLALELALAIQTPPFSAVRRFNEPFAIAVLLLAAAALRGGGALDVLRVRTRALAAFAVLTGLLFEGVDLVDAWNRRRAGEFAAEHARQLAGPGTAWYSAIHGISHYAQRAGLRLAGLNQATLRAGDVLVTPGIDDIELALLPSHARLLGTIHVGLRLPLRTMPMFYAGDRAIDHAGADDRDIALHFYAIIADMPVVSPGEPRP
jgi:hypothetical protein